MKNKFHILFFLVSVLLASSSSAQSPVFRQYNTRLGLASNEVYEIIQDHKGYIWIAHNAGVSRFDGYTFKNFETKDGLPDNTVFNIYEDSKGRIWFLPLSQKLSYFYNDSIYLYKYNDEIRKNLRGDLPMVKQSFRVDAADNVFFGMREQGVFKIDNKGKIYHWFTKELYDSHFLLMGKQRTEYVSVRSLIHKIKIIKDDKIYTIKDFTWINTGGIHFVIPMPNGKTLFSASYDILEINPDVSSKAHRLANPIIWMGKNNNDIWVGTYKNGVYCFKNGNIDLATAKHYLVGQSVSSVLFDREGGIWFSTLEGGVFYTASLDCVTFTTADGLRSDRCTALSDDFSGNLIIGLNKPFIHQLTGNTIKSIEISDLPSFTVSTFYKLQNKIYFGSNSGLGIVPEKALQSNDLYFDNRKEKRLPITVLSISELGDTIFTGGSYSISKIVDNKVAYESGLFKKHLRGLDIIRLADSLLIGTPNGLVSYKNNVFSDCGRQFEILSKRINRLHLYGDIILAGTKGYGLLLWNYKKNTINIIDTRKKLTSNTVTSLFVKNNVIWVGTEMGLNKITLADKDFDKYTIDQYTIENGLMSNEVNDIFVNDSLVFIASNYGLTRFNYVKNIVQSPTPPVYITAILINNKNQVLSNSLDLSYSENFIQLQFVGLGYKNAGKVMYRYKMEGLDKDWQYTRNIQLTYPFIPDGKYKFIISTCSDDGKILGSSTSIEIVVHPPFWKTWWFLAIVLLIVGIGIYAYIKIREKQLVAEKKLLEQRVAERTAEVVAQKEEIELQAIELEKLSIVARETDNAIMILDKDGNFEWLNEGFTRIYGYTLDEIKLLKGKSIIHTSGNSNLANMLAELITTAEPITYQALNVSKNGQKIWAQTTISPIFDVDKNIVKLVAIDSDISLLKIAEEEIRQQKEEIESQRDELEVQKNLVVQKNKDITDSINYAKRLQDAVLPTQGQLLKWFPQHFVIFRPKDIVSGDLYWAIQKGDSLFIAVMDCTGHGVPGAFMSIVCHNALERVVHEFNLNTPAAILNKLNTLVSAAMHNDETGVKDGMDIGLAVIQNINGLHHGECKLVFAGANNPAYFVSTRTELSEGSSVLLPSMQIENTNLYILKANRMAIGSCTNELPFTQCEFTLQQGDALYLFSDGFADQFGGPKGKKFKYKSMQKLLLELHAKPMEMQKAEFEKNYNGWMHFETIRYEQVDDNCMLGIKF